VNLKKAGRERLKAFEMWIWRRIERVRVFKGQSKKCNEEVFNAVGDKISLVQTVIKRKKNWIGHVMRRDGLMKDVMEGGIGGKRGKGRPRIRMFNELIDESYPQMKRKALDREAWNVWMPGACLRQSTNE